MTSYLKVGKITSVVFLVVFFVWGAVAPLDRGVAASGVITVTGNRKIVQAHTTAKVKEVLVKEGDQVQVDQPLIVLDVSSVENSILEEQRTVAVLEAQLSGAERAVVIAEKRLAAKEEIYQRLQQLVEKKFFAPARLYDLDVERAEIEQDLAGYQADVVRLRGSIKHSQQRITSLTSEVQGATIRSPATGQVVGLQVFAQGAVVQPGAKLLDVIPQDGSLFVDAKIPVTLIDQVAVGQPVTVRFTSLHRNTTPTVTGQLTVLATDRLTDPSGLPYFSAQVKILDTEKLNFEQLRPGMSADVFVKTGQRTFLSYLAKPIIDGGNKALRER